MKYTIPDCIGKLCNHKLNNFEFIITRQYKKFIVFYNVLKRFNDNIEKFCYIFVNPNVLCVDVTFDETVNTSDVLNALYSWVKPNTEEDDFYLSGEVEDQRVLVRIECFEKYPNPEMFTDLDTPDGIVIKAE